MIDRKKQILQRLNENVYNGSQNQSTLDTQEETDQHGNRQRPVTVGQKLC